MMVSECFHANRIILDYKYTDEYLNFIIKQIVYKNKIVSDQDLLGELDKVYDSNELKNSALKERFRFILGEKEKGKYHADEKIINDMNRFESFSKRVNDIYDLELFILSNSLNIRIETYDKFEYYFIIFICLYSKINNYTKFDTAIFAFNYLKTFDANISKLKNTIERIKRNYMTLSIYDVFEFSELEKRLLIKANVSTLADFCSINLFGLMILLSIHFIDFVNVLDTLSISIKKVIDDAYSVIDDKNLDILYRRNGYTDSKRYTLEELGKESNVTRERIRQLEAKTVVKVKNIAKENNNILYSFYNSELGKRKPYITLDRLKSKYDSDFINKILLLFEYGESDITYDSKYQILYNKTTNEITTMINDEIDKIGIVAEPAEIEKCDLFALNIVKYNYRKITDNLFIKSGYAYRDLYLDLIEKAFPNGFYVNNDDYDKFVHTVKERYKINEDIPSKHSLEAMIGRGGFVQFDRGAYISSKYAVSLEPDFADRILDYIGQNEFTYYNAIFDEFEKELTKIGIKNRYYLKGCLDKYLPDDMTTKRDYIVCGDTNITPYEAIINKLRSFPGRFTKNDIKEAFAGIKDYTIYNYLYSEIENGLIWISMNEYIYVNNYNIDDDTKKQLKDYIEFLFKNVGSKLLTSKKIYAKMQFTNKELFEKLNLTNGHFELFSIIKALFKEYYYSRPYIYLDEDEYNTRSSIVQNYVRQFDSFNYKMIQDYQSKLNLGVLYSYLSFMENMSDEYVQVDVDEMVKIEKMNLSEIKLNEIKKSIDLILDNFDVIDTTKFNGYSLLPKIGFIWNKYLLAGIVRSYFSEFYDIKNTDNRYISTDFEIRRV